MTAWTGQRFDYRGKSGVASSWLTGWTGTRSALWNGAEQAEKRMNSTVAREVQASIPRELTDDQGTELCRSFASWLSNTYGVAVDTSIHRPVRATRLDSNPHAHFLFTTRRVDLTSGSFGEKTREWDARPGPGVLASDRDQTNGRATCGKGCVDQVREQFEIMANTALTDAGVLSQVDRRTLADQMLDREPINYSRAVLELERRGSGTRQSEEMIRRKKRNNLRPAKSAASRPVPLPNVERGQELETAIDEQRLSETRVPERDKQREVERATIIERYRAAIALDRKKSEPHHQPAGKRPKTRSR